MALTQTRPESDSTESTAVASKPALERALSTSDHKTLGRLWVGAGAIFGVLALALSAMAGLEHADLDAVSIFSDEGQFVQAWSAGRVLVFFGCVVPILVGLATFLAPLQIGASAIAFGRGASAAFWTWLLSTGVLVIAAVQNGGPAGGTKDAVLLWILALGAMVFSICWALVCVATTILGARATGMRLEHVPASTWSFLVFSLLGLVSLPVLIGELGLAYVDVTADYLSTKTDRLQLLGLLDGVSFAPAIYWVAIPALGMALEILSAQSGRPVRFHKVVLGALGSLAVFSFAADLFAFGGGRAPIDFDNAILVLSVLGASLPMVLILGLALDTAKDGTITVNTPFVASLLSLVLLVLGATVAMIAQIDPVIGFIAEVTDRSIDVNSALLLNGSAFHEGLRGLILGATLLGAIGAVHHWGHKAWGHSLDDGPGMLSALLGAIGTLAWGGAYVATGLLEQPALPGIVEGPKDGVELLNLVAAVGLGLVAAAVGLLALGILKASAGRGSAIEPWSGQTLEWATTSPPPAGNFSAEPVVGQPASAENDTEEA